MTIVLGTAVTVMALSAMTKPEQITALKEVAHINVKVSTISGRTWRCYTPTIKERLQALPQSGDTFFIAIEKTKVVGYAVFYTYNARLPITWGLEEKSAYCSWIAVDPKSRSKGIGQALFKKIFESGVEKVRFVVRKDNISARRFYASLETIGCKYTEESPSGHEIHASMTSNKHE